MAMRQPQPRGGRHRWPVFLKAVKDAAAQTGYEGEVVCPEELDTVRL